MLLAELELTDLVKVTGELGEVTLAKVACGARTGGAMG